MVKDRNDASNVAGTGFTSFMNEQVGEKLLLTRSSELEASREPMQGRPSAPSPSFQLTEREKNTYSEMLRWLNRYTSESIGWRC